MVKSYGTITITMIDLAIAYDIQLSNSVIIKDTNGNYLPSTITIKGFSQQVNEDAQAYKGYYTIAESNNGTDWITTVAKSAASTSYDYTYQQKGILFIRVQMKDAEDNLLTQKIIPIVSEGTEGYTVFLDNESHTFLGDEVAAIEGEKVVVTPIVYKGSTREDVVITSITNVPSGLSYSQTSNPKEWISTTITVSKANTLKSSGTLDINFTADGKNFTKKFSYSVALKGAVGTGYEIVANSQIVRRKYNGATVPSEVEFKAYEVKTDDRIPYHGVLRI